jgi:CheY-like chemotaxis protein
MAQKILVVDDEKEFTSLIAQVLESRQYVVMQANSGQEALDLLSKDKFDLMTLDLNMPEMNGIEVAKITNEKYPDLKIMVISGFGSKYDDELPKYKIARILPKPVPFMDLIASVKEVIAQS